MKKLLIVALPAFVIFLSGFTGHGKKDVVNYLNTSDKIVLDDVTYKLSWSSHPTENYYKQEYLPAHETQESYSNMLLIDFLITSDSLKNVVASKVAEQQNQEITDIIAHHRTLKNKDKSEYLLDFILSDSKGRANANIVEWNGYRYKDYTDSQGHKGVLLFGWSKRAYRNDINEFLTRLRTDKPLFIHSLAQHEIPKIEVK